MIVVRDVFRLRFGEAKEAIAALREGREVARESGYAVERITADLTGEFYTLVMESSFESLAAYEHALRAVSESEAWQESYRRLVPLVESGRREIFRVVE